jgi:DNA segregation ATPase FtsK/SpoIIIE, S-DNA-T family
MNIFKKHFHKKKLKNAFSLAGLYYSTKWNNQTVRQFPHILDVREYENKTVYVFRLPHSIDPKEVKKKEFVFRSMFGELIELKGDHKVSLTVYNKVYNDSYDYEYNKLEPFMKKHSLPIIAGRDVNGEFYCYDMTKNPHLLIAGETGSGKSVMVRAILTSLIQHKRSGLQLHLADLKRNEFHLFRGVDIVRSVMTKKEDVAKCVKWFHDQMEQRGDLLDSYEVAHVDDLPRDQRLDYLVLCIDEFSILRDQKETIEQLCDLTALGRALGIYLILSTQRPDRNIVDGLMKANLTVRYAFRHADKVNSRITLGDGAKEDASTIDEEEKGKFFMRFSGCHYLQSPFLDVPEAKTILETYKSPVTTRAEYEQTGASDDIIDAEETQPLDFDLIEEEKK